MMLPPALQHLDQSLFTLVNSRWSNAVLDALLVHFRDRFFWIPLYIAIAALLLWFYRLKGLYIILLLCANLTLSDQLNSAVLKHLASRDRPCRNPALQSTLVLRVDACGGGKSFPSSHAANAFAFATLLSLLLRKKLRGIFAVSYLWAFAIAYAQVYVGLHYPLDIFAGMLTGILLGWLVWLAAQWIFLRRMHWDPRQIRIKQHA